MGKCDYCEREMQTTKSCDKHYYILPNKENVLAPKVGENDHTLPGERCHDCNAKYGEYHHLGCDNEFCLRCGGQIIFSCTCDYTDEIIMEKEVTPNQKNKQQERNLAVEAWNNMTPEQRRAINIPQGTSKMKMVDMIVKHLKANGKIQ